MEQVNQTERAVNEITESMGNIISVEGSPTKKAYFEVGTDGILRVKEA